VKIFPLKADTPKAVVAVGAADAFYEVGTFHASLAPFQVRARKACGALHRTRTIGAVDAGDAVVATAHVLAIFAEGAVA